MSTQVFVREGGGPLLADPYASPALLREGTAVAVVPAAVCRASARAREAAPNNIDVTTKCQDAEDGCCT